MKKFYTVNNQVAQLHKIILEIIAKNIRISPNSNLLKEYKSSLPPLTDYQKEALIGLSLGDINLSNRNNDLKLRMEWGAKNLAYVSDLWSEFKHWILSPPKFISRSLVKNGKIPIYETYRFETISHPCFNFLRPLFLDEKSKKQITPNLVQDHLTPIGIAYWFRDDGGKIDYSKNQGKGLVFNTQGFTESEVDLLVKEMANKWQLNVWKGHNKGLPIVKISGKNYEQIVALITPHIIPEMIHKLPTPRKVKKT